MFKRFLTPIMLAMMLFTSAAPVLAQNASAITAPARTSWWQQAPVRTECQPWMEVSLFEGNVGSDEYRVLKTFRHEGYTVPQDEPTLLAEFFQYGFTSKIGRTTTVGHPDVKSWIKFKLEKDIIFVKYWLQNIKMGTGEEFDISGGAFEAQLLLKRFEEEGRCGWRDDERWVWPEGFRTSQFGVTKNYGTFANLPSLMFAYPVTWLSPGYGGDNFMEFNYFYLKNNVITWKPFFFHLPGKDQKFGFGIVRIGYCP